MRSALTTAYRRGTGALGRLSMYRGVLVALGALAAIAFVLSWFGLVVPTPLGLVATALVLVVVGLAVDAVAHRVVGTPWRPESTLITSGILLFVLWPGSDLLSLAGVAISAAAAALSKYLIAWRGRHILNPAAVGAVVATLLSHVSPDLGGSAWWVATPWLFVPLVVLGLIVAWRTEKIGIVALVVVVAGLVSAAWTIRVLTASGSTMLLSDLVLAVTVQAPFLFLAAFMLTEPLTMPARRWQQYLVAAVVAVLAGWPVAIGSFTFAQQGALLVGNILAFALVGARRRISLRLDERREIAPGVDELVFTASGLTRFQAGQYLELEVPHRRADARGTRREFSIVSAPEDLPTVRVAYRDGESSFKRALAAVEPGKDLSATGVWGDFVLPRDEGAPVLLVAAGIGVTPFVSQLRQSGGSRDIVVVDVAPSASALAYRDELEAADVAVVVCTPDEPAALASGWSWSGGERLTPESLDRLVPDLRTRHAYVSGPPSLVADLAPALRRARSLATDAFAGY